MRATRERGTRLERPPAPSPDQVDAVRLYGDGPSYAQIARALGVGKSTIARVLAGSR
ncbi:helix-turn-helix domain-containing protein [Microbacterium sp. YY-01]|uniref:helix-turn-helix domain-containing protein n=1 Tax=Microbacterium sp. YY-01 TaxID=3421634 RepID=UPI003D1718A3